MREIVIAPKDSEGKGRSFRSLLLASVEADTMWDGGSTDTDAIRPVWAMFAGSDDELRPFGANLRIGRKAIFIKETHVYRRSKDEKLELLKSAGYEYTWQREAEGSVMTSFLPDLFHMDPGMVDTTGVRFIMLPTIAWREAQKIDVGPVVKHAMRFRYPVTDEMLAEWVPLSFLFAAYLDRRTRCPLLSDGRFYLQLMLACLKEGLASWSMPADRPSYHDRLFGQHAHFRFTETDTADVGLARGLAFQSDHARLEEILAHEVSLFFMATRGR